MPLDNKNISARVCIIGLGYVGLPLACLAARKGFEVSGLDINNRTVEHVNAGKSPIADKHLEKELADLKGRIHATTNPAECLSKNQIIVVCVPTPVDEKFNPDLEPVKKACETIALHLQKGQLVIVESTVYPGTTEEVVKPILESKGLVEGKDFDLAFCPERVNPGDEKWNLEKIPRVLGGFSDKGTARAHSFYAQLLGAPIRVMRSAREAEAVKILENVFRDINIAMVNELARSFDHLGIDTVDVIEGAKTKPFGFMPFYPGPGVGGHCIPVDPYYLIEKGMLNGFNHQFLVLARKINSEMPLYVIERVQEALNEFEKGFKNSRIGVLGVTYKGNVDDVRESPALKVIAELQKKGALLSIFDPWTTAQSHVSSLEEALKEKDCVVLLTDHKEFIEMPLEKLAQAKVKSVVDARNVWDKEKVKALGILYLGVGRK